MRSPSPAPVPRLAPARRWCSHPHQHAGDAAAMAAFFERLHGESGVRGNAAERACADGRGLGCRPSGRAGAASARHCLRQGRDAAVRASHHCPGRTRRRPTSAAVFGGAGARYVLDELSRGAVGTMPACEITEVHVAMLAGVGGRRSCACARIVRTHPAVAEHAGGIPLAADQGGSAATRGSSPTTRCAPRVRPWMPSDQRELDILLSRIGDLLPLDRVPGKVQRMSA